MEISTARGRSLGWRTHPAPHLKAEDVEIKVEELKPRKLRLKESAHAIEVVMRAVPDEHRQVLVCWFNARWNLLTGAERDIDPRIDLELICEDCPDAATAKCDDCGIPRAILNDTELE